MKSLVSRLVLGLVVVALTATAALAQSIHVTAETTFPTASPGGFEEVGCRVDNLANEPIRVQISGTIIYSDGSTQTILRPGQPVSVDLDGSFITFIFFAVPADALRGTATFECSVRAIGIQGGSERQSALSTFEVLP